MATLYITLQGKGGIGKSYVSSVVYIPSTHPLKNQRVSVSRKRRSRG